MNPWLDFQKIKQSVPLGVVLEHYRWKWRRRHGDRAEGRCPIHRGQREDAFHADLRNNGFHCFSCQAHGSVLDLVAAMERCSLRHAAWLITEWFGQEPWPTHNIRGERKRELIREKEVKPVPLPFSLRPVDAGHRYLRQRGIDADTATRFGVGYYAGPGFMHDRVVIPIHDEHGQLLAYAGRSICGGGPKYKLPAGFPKSSVLFNLHRARACHCDSVIVVEGFFDCLKVDQAGLPNVVALLGCCLSSRQELLLVEQFRNVTLMLDADGAGQHGTRVIADRLSPQCGVQIVHLENGQQPDQLSSAEIRRALFAVAAAGGRKIVE